jgi:hypothetical protein
MMKNDDNYEQFAMSVRECIKFNVDYWRDDYRNSWYHSIHSTKLTVRNPNTKQKEITCQNTM